MVFFLSLKKYKENGYASGMVDAKKKKKRKKHLSMYFLQNIKFVERNILMRYLTLKGKSITGKTFSNWLF